MSNGTNLLKVTIDTTRELAAIGDELKIGEKYFTALSSHLYNADGVFLPLSIDKDCIKLTSDILEEAVEQGMNHEPVPFKRLKTSTPKNSLRSLVLLPWLQKVVSGSEQPIHLYSITLEAVLKTMLLCTKKQTAQRGKELPS